MKIRPQLKRHILIFVIVAVNITAAFGQRSKLKPKPQNLKSRPIIFAVINDGALVEPIASIDNGKLSEVGTNAKGESSAAIYYRSGMSLDLIFGGAVSGSVAVKKSNIGTECGGSSADVSVNSSTAKLKGFVMALATDSKSTAKAAGLRRLPTPGERTEIEALVRAEYSKHKVLASATKQLHYYNLTAVDVDNDGIPELVGSYWIAPNKTQRDLLFFIAEKKGSEKYTLVYSDFSAVGPKDLMSGDPKDIDQMGGELMLDLFDYDNDGTEEIFTIAKAFEGNNYHVYKRSVDKWTRVFEAYDYRCAY